jgi:hypothetical protein
MIFLFSNYMGWWWELKCPVVLGSGIGGDYKFWTYHSSWTSEDPVPSRHQPPHHLGLKHFMWLICQVVGHKVSPLILTPADVGRSDHGCVRMVSPSRTVAWAFCSIVLDLEKPFCCGRFCWCWLASLYCEHFVVFFFLSRFLFERVWWSLQFCQGPTVEDGTEAPEDMLLLQCKGQLSCKNTQPN